MSSGVVRTAPGSCEHPSRCYIGRGALAEGPALKSQQVVFYIDQ